MDADTLELVEDRERRMSLREACRELVRQATGCPVCPAEQGERCRGQKGQLRWSNHQQRWTKARNMGVLA